SSRRARSYDGDLAVMSGGRGLSAAHREFKAHSPAVAVIADGAGVAVVAGGLGWSGDGCAGAGAVMDVLHAGLVGRTYDWHAGSTAPPHTAPAATSFRLEVPVSKSVKPKKKLPAASNAMPSTKPKPGRSVTQGCTTIPASTSTA